MGEPKPSVYEWMSQFVRPADKITDKQADILLDAPGVRFPPQIRLRMKYYIIKNWPTRPGKKSAFDLFKEAGHPCVYEYFNTLIKGDEHNPPFEQKIEQSLKSLEEIDSNDPMYKQSVSDVKGGIEIQYEELSKVFTEGFFRVMKDNLVFNKKGIPIAVREGDDRQRFSQCHAKLSEDYYEQTSKRLGPDQEAEGVAGKAFEGHGKTRRRRRKGKKTKARKMRSRR